MYTYKVSVSLTWTHIRVHTYHRFSFLIIIVNYFCCFFFFGIFNDNAYSYSLFRLIYYSSFHCSRFLFVFLSSSSLLLAFLFFILFFVSLFRSSPSFFHSSSSLLLAFLSPVWSLSYLLFFVSFSFFPFSLPFPFQLYTTANVVPCNCH